jgi:hypothetical protein
VRETHLGGLRAVRDDRSRVRDDGRLAPNFSVIDDELQRSVDNEIRLRGGDVMRRRATGVGSTRQCLQWSDNELGWRLGFPYLWMKICRRTGTIYRAFGTYS